MDIKQRDKILKLTREAYSMLGCVFPKNNQEMIEYLNESVHPDEERCLLIAIKAHNVYNEDTLDEYDFFDWHGL